MASLLRWMRRFLGMISARTVADYFLALQDEDAGDLISNLKLQKLLYYAQGLHLAAFAEPLFNEPIEAWKHGPVVPLVYHSFKHHGGDPIPIPVGVSFDDVEQEKKEFLDDIYRVYGQFSAWKLRNMTHDETPYQLAEPTQGVISHESLKSFFKDYVSA